MQMRDEWLDGFAEQDVLLCAKRMQDIKNHIDTNCHRQYDAPLDMNEVQLFLCDENFGKLSEEEKPSFVSIGIISANDIATAFSSRVYTMRNCGRSWPISFGNAPRIFRRSSRPRFAPVSRCEGLCAFFRPGCGKTLVPAGSGDLRRI